MATGIVLGGGGTKAFAHLGVLQALQEAEIKPDMISGASAGAIMGAFIADGKTPEETLGIMKLFDIMDYVSFNWPLTGLLDLDNLERKLKKRLAAKTFEELKIPLYVAASNLRTGYVEYLGAGPLATAVKASSSIPFLFEPVEIGGQKYCDGGLLDNLPYAPLKGKCETIITVNVARSREAGKLNDIVEIALRAMEIVLGQDKQSAVQESAMYIEPEGTENYFLFDTGHAEELFDLGYAHAKKMLGR